MAGRTKERVLLLMKKTISRCVIAAVGMAACFLVWSVAVSAQTLQVEKSVCRQIAAYQPEARVAYQPGVDVRGRPVVPADVNAVPLGDFENQIRIKLTNDTAKLFGLNLPNVAVNKVPIGQEQVPLVNPEMEVGFITFQDGHPFLNGKALESDAATKLRTLCSGALSEER